MEDYIIANLRACPRCEFEAYECLATHSFCADCGYCPDTTEYYEHVPAIPDWAIACLAGSGNKKNQNEQDESEESCETEKLEIA